MHNEHCIGMLCALAHGANVNFMNSTEELKCPLIASILAVCVHMFTGCGVICLNTVHGKISKM